MAGSSKNISFKVSARTARLIGRENVATANGAVTELVKNAYDADARICALCLLQKYTDVPNEIKSDEYDYLVRQQPDLSKFFTRKNNSYHLVKEIAESKRADLENIFKEVVDLWIIDNGSGMASKDIEEKWMVIGTNSKETNAKSSAGRIMTGAKGIGRFALDRLGEKSELYSSRGDKNNLVHWAVDWNAFEGEEKTLDDIKAVLNTRHQTFSDLISEIGLDGILPETAPGQATGSELLSYNTGTAIRLQHMRDNWDKRSIETLKGTLEALLPPKDRNDFNIYVYDQREPDNCGWIDNFPPDQFDYRLKASVKGDGRVEIRLDRHEIDVENIRPSFYSLNDMKTSGYTETDFRKGFYAYTTSLDKIFNANGSRDISEIKEVGPFEFTMYYFKLSNPSKNNLKKFPQKSFDVTKRRQWVKHSGGIRLYRDEFRVRPYGEPGTPDFDWLLLGERTAQNPTAISTEKGNWPVPPHQVAGSIHISKVSNPLLADQSNREGIMNEHSFFAFREIIVGLIKEFETDRNLIHRNFNRAYKIDHPEEDILKEARGLAKKINANNDDEETSSKEQRLKDQKQESKTLAKALEIITDKEKDTNDEIRVLRGMATLGTVLVSFTHELKQIKTNIDARQRRMKKSLDIVVDANRLNRIPLQLSPYDILERWDQEDQQVSCWVNFALSSVTRSKRRRKPIRWQEYFNNIATYWNIILLDRKIEFKVPMNLDQKLSVLAHEIDLDSVFYNLIINSIEVLTRPNQARNRKIEIKHLSADEKEIVFEYSDNGPGISDVFRTTADIFNYGVTSKPEIPGQQIEGTGIGMAIVKEVIDDYGGNVRVLSQLGVPDFRLELSWPSYNRPGK